MARSREEGVVFREEFRLESDGILLAAALFVPEDASLHPGLILCHGMPAGPRLSGEQVGSGEEDPGYPELAERCARAGFVTLIFNFRGTGQSGGNYHPLGWARDLEAVLDWMGQLPQVDAKRIALLGSSMGAAVAMYVAAHRPEVAAVVSYAGPAAMGPRPNPADAVERLRESGLIRDTDFPPDLDAWSRESVEISPVEWIGKISPRPLLLLHGDADDLVPVENAFTLYQQAGEPKELRLLPGAGHRFRSEPAALETALEWLLRSLV